MKGIYFFENHSEIGAGTRGSSLGIDAMQVASWKKKSTLLADWPTTQIQDENALLFTEDQHPTAHHIQGIVQVYERLTDSISNHLTNLKSFPVVLAADHASAGGTIAGIKKAFPNKRLGAIWVDAHADLHSPYTSPSGNVHGMPLSTALGSDNLACQKKEVKPETAEYWNQLKGMGGTEPKINPSDLVFIAVRDTEAEEEYLMTEHNIPNFKVSAVREQGAEAIAQAALNHLKDCDMIYISFDVDSMDPDEVSYGTGTPVKDGLTEQEAKELLHTMVQSPKVNCLEVVEVNPTLDNKGNVMAETALRILENTVSTIISTRK